eukprot:TRINITY_DN19090_c0_g1_i1.p1 TRINITY_DN19090_c0_g1~~TRINITY_DN19090_c0_g1_i1.p1  ORF type:complete len:518 (+),score=74.60 TRINITY_DN19090_c0_g1_i1:132-1556(+)
MAEICSTYPAAGSVYYWAGMLAHDHWAPLFSYICGWSNLLGNIGSTTAFASGFATLVASAISSSTGYILAPIAQVGISTAALLTWCLLNITRIDQHGFVSTCAAIYQVISSLIIVIVVLSVSATHSSADFVFFHLYNGTGLDNDACWYVVLIGVLTTLFAFTGYEAGGHIAEETQDARNAAPRGIVTCCYLATAVGFTYVVGLLFSIPGGDIPSLLGGDRSQKGGLTSDVFTNKSITPLPLITSPFNVTYNNIPSNHSVIPPLLTSFNDNVLMNLFLASMGSNGALGLIILVILNVYFAGASSVTVTSRISYALARDGGYPFSASLKQLNPITKAPVRLVVVIILKCWLLLLLQLVNTTAFWAIVSITTIGLQISYAIPIWLRVTQSRISFTPGPFHLGRFSLVCGWISAIWLTATSLLFFFPFKFPITAQNMNYTSVVVGVVVCIASIFWIVNGRHWFKGPHGLKKVVKITID